VRRVTGVVLAVALAVAAGCGAPDGGGVERSDPEAVPFGLLEEGGSSGTGPVAGPSPVVEVYLALGDDSGLVPVPRRVADSSLIGVLGELQAEPTEAEAALDLRNPLDERDVVRSAAVVDGVATVDLDADFTEISRSGQLLAVAQLVLTATARPGVDEVVVTLDGGPTEVPRGDGTLTRDALTRADYLELVATG
jgi:spore germination protein GerM